MASADPLTRRGFLVTGRVQGVGYRWFAAETARGLGLSGWVMNREDGAVTGEAEGAAATLDAFMAALREGPPAARVAQVKAWDLDAKGEAGFEIRRER